MAATISATLFQGSSRYQQWVYPYLWELTLLKSAKCVSNRNNCQRAFASSTELAIASTPHTEGSARPRFWWLGYLCHFHLRFSTAEHHEILNQPLDILYSHFVAANGFTRCRTIRTQSQPNCKGRLCQFCVSLISSNDCFEHCILHQR